jgi:hypothetical protein
MKGKDERWIEGYTSQSLIDVGEPVSFFAEDVNLTSLGSCAVGEELGTPRMQGSKAIRLGAERSHPCLPA